MDREDVIIFSDGKWCRDGYTEEQELVSEISDRDGDNEYVCETSSNSQWLVKMESLFTVQNHLKCMSY